MSARGDAIELEVIGDSSLFTRLGKGVSYLVRAGASEYLIDSGATPFLALGHERLKRLKGLFATHSHEDHRRWFTDIALYLKYHPDCQTRLKLVTAERIHEEFEKNSRGALEASLSADSRRVVSVPYSEFVEKVFVGPKARYFAAQVGDEESGRVWRVVDAVTREVVPPGRAKVFLPPSGGRPRILFMDPDEGLWVEPESYYPFSSRVFYEEDERPLVDPETGLAFRAVKAPVWHGPPTVGLVLSLGDERLAFSSDTVYDQALWRELAGTRRELPAGAETPAFREAPFVRADINDFIQQTWSAGRLEEALAAFQDAILVHDADFEASVVHTSHSKLRDVNSWRRLVLTHTPERFASPFPITATGKRYVCRDRDVFEVVRGEEMPLDADVYFKDAAGDLHAGYESASGQGRLWETRRGNAVVVGSDDPPWPGAKMLGRYDVYRDVEGGYYPILTDPASSYRVRTDGLVEVITETADTSRGRLAEDRRPGLAPSRVKRAP